MNTFGVPGLQELTVWYTQAAKMNKISGIYETECKYYTQASSRAT